MAKDSFFMVYLQGERTPAFRHRELPSAENEAKRLAKEHNKKAYVLCSIKSFEVSEFQVENCIPEIDTQDDLPF